MITNDNSNQKSVVQNSLFLKRFSTAETFLGASLVNFETAWQSPQNQQWYNELTSAYRGNTVKKNCNIEKVDNPPALLLKHIPNF